MSPDERADAWPWSGLTAAVEESKFIIVRFI